MTLKLNGTTSGSVSLDAPATGSDVSFTLPGSVGTSGQLLSTDGAGVLSFVNGGKILQVVRDTDTTDRTTTSTSFVDVTGMSVTITPQKSNSSVILIATGMVESLGANGGRFQITDNSNNAISGAETALLGGPSGAVYQYLNLWAYASPATTSAVTYKVRFRRETTATSLTLYNSQSTGQLLAIEVSA